MTTIEKRAVKTEGSTLGADASDRADSQACQTQPKKERAGFWTRVSQFLFGLGNDEYSRNRRHAQIEKRLRHEILSDRYPFTDIEPGSWEQNPWDRFWFRF
jgi:hypothetical protein